MNMKKEQNKQETGFQLSLVMKKVLLLLLVSFSAKGIVIAEEIFNKPIVETFSQMIGTDEFYFAGIDVTGDGFADIFLNVPYINQDPILKRLASLLKEGATVSFDDKTKYFFRGVGLNLVNPSALLEINGRSVLQIFPGQNGTFRDESTRQAQLQGNR